MSPTNDVAPEAGMTTPTHRVGWSRIGDAPGRQSKRHARGDRAVALADGVLGVCDLPAVAGNGAILVQLSWKGEETKGCVIRAHPRTACVNASVPLTYTGRTLQ